MLKPSSFGTLVPNLPVGHFLQSAPWAVLCLDSNLRLLYANHRMIELAGRSLGELLGRPLQSFVSQGSPQLAEVCARILEAKESSLNSDIFLEMPAHAGLTRYYRVALQPHYEGSSIRPAGVVLYFEEMEKSKALCENQKQSTEMFNLMTNGIAEVFWVADCRASKFIFMSAGYERLWKRSVDSLYLNNEDFFLALHSEDRGKVECFLRDSFVMGGGEDGAEIEFRLSNPDGGIHWLWMRVFPVFDKYGKSERIAGTILDVTEQKNNQRFIESVTEATPNLIYVFDVIHGKLVYSSGRGYELLGYSREHIKAGGNDFWRDILHPEDQALSPGRLLRWLHVNNNEVVETEYRLKDTRDNWHWFVSYDTVFSRTIDGRVHYVVGTAIDVTERVAAENERRRSEERFKKYFGLDLIGIAVTGLDKSWVEVNDGVCLLFGYSRKELLLKTWAELTYHEDLAADEVLFSKLLKGEIESYKMDKRFVRKGGEVVFTSIAVTCIRQETGEPDQIVALIQDITDRKQTENELAQYKEHLEELVRERTRDLKSLNEKLRAEISERMNIENSLQKKNIALNELLSQIEIEKKNIREQVLANIERLVVPTIKKLQVAGPEIREDYVLLLLRSMRELTSSFGSNISTSLYKLTPREIEICNMIKSRLSNKEIAHMLNISLRTVETHRNEIRKKLNLARKGINLASYLQSF